MFNYRQAKSAHLRLGRHGEDIACRYLRSLDIDILMRNYRHKKGEIDIIARDGTVLSFVEVKTRSASSHSSPAEGLSAKQKLRITQAAEAYLHSLENPEVIYRFDLIEIIIGKWDITSLRYWREHFSAGK